MLSYSKQSLKDILLAEEQQQLRIGGGGTGGIGLGQGLFRFTVY